MATIFSDNFNSYTNGDLNGQGSWSGSVAFDVQGTTTYEGAKAVQGDSNANIDKVGTGVTPGSISVYIRSNKTTVQLGLHLKEGANLKIFFDLMANGNIQYRNPDSTWTTVLASYAADTWYNLQIEWRNSGVDSEVRYRVDSGSWTAWVAPFVDWTTNLDTVRLETWDVVAGFIGYYDNISEIVNLVSVTEPTTLSEIATHKANYYKSFTER